MHLLKVKPWITRSLLIFLKHLAFPALPTCKGEPNCIGWKPNGSSLTLESHSVISECPWWSPLELELPSTSLKPTELLFLLLSLLPTVKSLMFVPGILSLGFLKLPSPSAKTGCSLSSPQGSRVCNIYPWSRGNWSLPNSMEYQVCFACPPYSLTLSKVQFVLAFTQCAKSPQYSRMDPWGQWQQNNLRYTLNSSPSSSFLPDVTNTITPMARSPWANELLLVLCLLYKTCPNSILWSLLYRKAITCSNF